MAHILQDANMRMGRRTVPRSQDWAECNAPATGTMWMLPRSGGKEFRRTACTVAPDQRQNPLQNEVDATCRRRGETRALLHKPSYRPWASRRPCCFRVLTIQGTAPLMPAPKSVRAKGAKPNTPHEKEAGKTGSERPHTIPEKEEQHNTLEAQEAGEKGTVRPHTAPAKEAKQNEPLAKEAGTAGNASLARHPAQRTMELAKGAKAAKQVGRRKQLAAGARRKSRSMSPLVCS